MQRYFIYLAYEGTNYHGWQVQPNGISVQECLQKALSTLLRTPMEIVGAGRTDAGVHAKLMVAHFDFEGAMMSLSQLTDKLNRLLPHDISVYKVCTVKPDAHARFDAISRTYKYYVTNVKSPFNRHLKWRIHTTLDYAKMNEASRIMFDFIDFTSFSKLHTDVKTNNCKMMHAQWTQEDENTWVFTVQADRFLRNMVRAIVGTLVEVGSGKMSIEQFRQVIEQKDRCKAGASVPGHALFLVDIEYPSEIFI